MSASRLIPLLLLGSLVMNAEPKKGQEARASPAAPQTVELSGPVLAKDGKYMLTDETTCEAVELRGSDLNRFAGKRAAVTGEVKQGEPVAAGVSRIVMVATIDAAKAQVKTKACHLPAGAAAAGKAAGGAAAGAGGGHTAAVLGAVGLAAGGAVAGLYSAGVVGEESASRQ